MISKRLPFSHQALASPSGTTQNIDWSLGNGITIDLESTSGDLTLSFSNALAGRLYTVIILSGSTPRDVVWPFTWPNGVNPEISKTENVESPYHIYYDGTNFHGIENINKDILSQRESNWLGYQVFT